MQLARPSQGFRCLFCGFALAPGYATVAPGVAARAMAAQATLVSALTGPKSMTGDRLAVFDGRLWLVLGRQGGDSRLLVGGWGQLD